MSIIKCNRNMRMRLMKPMQLFIIRRSRWLIWLRKYPRLLRLETRWWLRAWLSHPRLLNSETRWWLQLWLHTRSTDIIIGKSQKMMRLRKNSKILFLKSNKKYLTPIISEKLKMLWDHLNKIGQRPRCSPRLRNGQTRLGCKEVDWHWLRYRNQLL